MYLGLRASRARTIIGVEVGFGDFGFLGCGKRKYRVSEGC